MQEPSIKLLSLSDQRVEFEMAHVQPSITNALRRIMMSGVPSLSIDLVEIERNSTQYVDEFLVHRLALIPLRCASSRMIQDMEFADECKCDSDWCSQCGIEMTLHARNDQDDILYVFAKDLECKENKHGILTTIDHGLDNASSLVLLKLARGQEIKLSAVAKKGIGKQHAKWSPVCVANPRFEPSVSIKKPMSAFDIEEVIKACPARVFSKDAKTGEIRIDNPKSCVYCGECTKKSDAVQVQSKPDRWIFTMESTGVLPAADILMCAMQILKKKLVQARFLVLDQV